MLKCFGLLIQMLSDLHLLMLKPIGWRSLMHSLTHWPNGSNLQKLKLSDLQMLKLRHFGWRLLMLKHFDLHLQMR